ncbi:MAG: glycosyltransferase N-terminal domain-containing protein, partial [Pirellula sp.]
MLTLAKQWLLNVLYGLLLVAVCPWILYRRMTQGRYKQGWSEKLFGSVPNLAINNAQRPTQLQDTKTIWFHAVSVGELQVIRPLVERAASELPSAKLLISTSTDSGLE